jgi:hypothetical protein
MLGVWIEPVTAQVMITLRLGCAMFHPSWRLAGRLVLSL